MQDDMTGWLHAGTSIEQDLFADGAYTFSLKQKGLVLVGFGGIF